MSFEKVYSGILIDLKISDDRITEFLDILCEACSSQIALDFYSSPAFSVDKKIQTIRKAFGGKGFPEELIGFAEILIKNKRISDTKKIAQFYKERVEQSTGLVRGQVFSAAALKDKEMKEIEGVIENVLKVSKVSLSFIQDKKLIGDVRVEAGGCVIDGSLICKYKNLENKLKGQTL